MLLETIREFHAHIYYSEATRSSAEQLREDVQRLAGGRLKVYTLSDGPRGPHVTPMFGVDIPSGDLAEVVGFLMLNHGPHAVLVHPETGQEVLDHSHRALWLGQPQVLDLSRLAK